jgi:acetyl esterase/lipase
MHVLLKKLSTLSALALCALASPAGAADLQDFLALPRPAPTHEISYGAAQSQGIDVFLPTGKGPHPVALLIHGGCWSDFPGAGREQLRPLAADWARRGIAVWSMGYRRANEAGGGYPHLYRDVATAVDRLRTEAPKFGIDTSRSVLTGHSAGGHLALWTASRTRLPAGSPLQQSGEPLPVRGVVSIAGVGDLAAFAPRLPGSCGRGILQRLSGGGSDPFADVSPARLGLPDVVRSVVMVSAADDQIVPLLAARDYRNALPAEAASRVRLRDVASAGHFDGVTPGTPAFEAVFEEVQRLLR